MSSLKGKVAIITGSSSGIGAATAKLFAQKGCSVSLTGRNEANLKKVQQECIDSGLKADQVAYFVGEITDETFLKRLVDGTIEKFGKLDILINNAGMAIIGPITNSPIVDFDKTFNVNVRSVILLTQLCIPHLTKTKGTIVNNSSIAAIKAADGFGYYCMSKAALDMSMKCFALELASHGIRVNSVNPGFIDTPIHEKIVGDLNKVDSLKKRFALSSPMKRPGRSEEIAEAFAFMASDNASFITGQTLFVDGGYTLGTVDIPS